MTIEVEDSVIVKFQQFIKTSFPQHKVKIINDVVVNTPDETDEVIAMSDLSANAIKEWNDLSEDLVWK